MDRALQLAWESFAAGSFGIGAVVALPDGTEVATGRNRILERDPGDDVLAGSSLAHAEMNALAKLPYRRHHGDELQLFTTLQPCLQCLGAIRLSPVRLVYVLAPDPLFRGVERIADVNPFVASNWPSIVELEVDEQAVLSLLFPTHLGEFWGLAHPWWPVELPVLTELARQLVASGELVDLAASVRDVSEVLAVLHDRLAECVDEVRHLQQR
jgi:tRNA(Arg) A34 adenosine deaminase TadA